MFLGSELTAEEEGCCRGVEKVVGLRKGESQPHSVGGKSKALLIWKAPSHTPRRSVRIRNKCPQNALSFLSRQGMPTVSLSDGDIDNCNLRLREPVSPEEPIKLWDISRKVGIRCRKDEQEVIQEFSSLEERDLKTMSCVEEGKKGGLL